MTRDKMIEVCAEAAHEANRVWCQAHGDDSQLVWWTAPEWQRSSAIAGVAGVLAGNTPEQQHAVWMEAKVGEGWRYGPVKNAETREHPCMVPYDALPPEQRAKDAIYIATVRAFAAALGLS